MNSISRGRSWQCELENGIDLQLHTEHLVTRGTQSIRAFARKISMNFDIDYGSEAEDEGFRCESACGGHLQHKALHLSKVP